MRRQARQGAEKAVRMILVTLLAVIGAFVGQLQAQVAPDPNLQ